MTKDEIRDVVGEVISGAKSSAELTDTANLADDLGFDSLMFISLVTALEKKFKISIQPDEINLEDFKNIETISRLLERKARV